jgi:hypothetical protein
VALYVVILSQWPTGGTVTWSDGGPLAKGLIVAAAASGVLALLMMIQTAARWRGRRGSVLGRLNRTAVAAAILAGAWGLLDLVGWL